jgi:hypothetical protein
MSLPNALDSIISYTESTEKKKKEDALAFSRALISSFPPVKQVIGKFAMNGIIQPIIISYDVFELLACNLNVEFLLILLKINAKLITSNLLFLTYNGLDVDTNGSLSLLFARVKKLMRPANTSVSGLHNVVDLCINVDTVKDTKLKDVFYYLDIKDTLNNYNGETTDVIIKNKLGIQ